MKNEIMPKTSFLKIMGATPVNRVIDFLIENDRDSWTMKEISDNANIGYSTLKIILPRMIKREIITIKKKVGTSNLYVINKENPVVNKIYELYNTINKQEIMALA